LTHLPQPAREGVVGDGGRMDIWVAGELAGTVRAHYDPLHLHADMWKMMGERMIHAIHTASGAVR
jgi:hypothetical protein